MAILEGPTDTAADALSGFTVEDHVGFLLRRAHQRHVALFTARLAASELTPTQFTALLKTVERGRITQNHLGRLAAMDPATIQGVVLITKVVACARQAHEAALAPLDPDERTGFLALLRKMG